MTLWHRFLCAMTIKRYHIEALGNSSGLDIEDWRNGRWCEWSDVEPIVERLNELERENAWLRRILDRIPNKPILVRTINRIETQYDKATVASEWLRHVVANMPKEDSWPARG